MSTGLVRTELTAVPTRKAYEVEIATLDDLIDLHLPDAQKIGLKIDTEGFEMDVIADLDRHLQRIDFIVSEASVLNRSDDSYNFSELATDSTGASSIRPRRPGCRALQRSDWDLRRICA